MLVLLSTRFASLRSTRMSSTRKSCALHRQLTRRAVQEWQADVGQIIGVRPVHGGAHQCPGWRSMLSCVCVRLLTRFEPGDESMHERTRDHARDRYTGSHVVWHKIYACRPDIPFSSRFGPVLAAVRVVFRSPRRASARKSMRIFCTGATSRISCRSLLSFQRWCGGCGGAASC